MPARSRDLNPCDFHLTDMLKEKVYMPTTRNLWKIFHNSRTAASACVQKHILTMYGIPRSRRSSLRNSSTEQGKLKCSGNWVMSYRLLKRVYAREAPRQLWKLCNLNVRIARSCRFIRKFPQHFAASCYAPVHLNES